MTVDSFAWDEWKPTHHAVLCFIRAENQLLLIHKKRGLGAGKINAPGGKLDPGETAAEAAVRETREEVGLVPMKLVECGRLSFVFTDGYSLHVTVFLAGWAGEEARETDEALPFWCAIDEIPYERMWEDDALWLPQVLAGSRVEGQFIFEESRMLSHRIEILGSV